MVPGARSSLAPQCSNLKSFESKCTWRKNLWYCWDFSARLAVIRRPHSRGGTVSGMPESTPAGFCVFLADPESKSCEKPDPESLFNFGSSKSLCGHFLSKKMVKLQLDRWLQPESEQESDSQIWKTVGPGFKNFGTGAESESEKVTPTTSAP